jgi:hypothetical protein
MHPKAGAHAVAFEKRSRALKKRRGTLNAMPGSDPSERRNPLRKDVFLSGILVDVDGKGSSDCVIRDINGRGAAISLCRTLPTGAQTILLDTGNRMAHFARVVWSNAGSSGLLFVRSYPMSRALPPRLAFLWRLLLEANLRQAQRAVATGVRADLALASIGLTREQIHHLARYAQTNRGLQQLLDSARRLLRDR